MNFNKDYPIAILDTNIAISVPNILNILKGCNIVIPYTLIDELDKLKKEKKGARDFVNNFLAISENANLSKDGYKLENDCMLYVDRDNLSHKDVKLDSTAKKEDIKFIAVQKNLKEKYNDMEVVLISSDKIMKITASTFDVEIKFLEEFIMEYLKEDKLNILFDLLEEYINNKDIENYYKLYNIIFEILTDNEDINGLYKLADNTYMFKRNRNNKLIYYKCIFEEVYNIIFKILSENKDIDGFYNLAKNYNYTPAYQKISEFLVNDKDINGLYELAQYYINAYSDIFNILANDKDIDGLFKLSEIYKSKEVSKRILEILSENKDIDGLYKLAENEDPDKTITVITDENKNIEVNFREEIYSEILEILSENKDIDGLYKLAENEDANKLNWTMTDETDKNKKIKVNLRELIYSKILEILSENKDIDGLYKLIEVENENIEVNFREVIYSKIFEILVKNKDAKGLIKLVENEDANRFEWFDGENNYRKEVKLIDLIRQKIIEISETLSIDGLYKLLDAGNDHIDKLYNNRSNLSDNIVIDVSKTINKIFEILSNHKDIDGLYKLAENINIKKCSGDNSYYRYYTTNEFDERKIYDKIFEILSGNKDIDGLYKLYEKYKKEEIYKKIFKILSEAENWEELFKLVKKYNNKEVYEEICKILEKEKDKNKLYKLTKNEDVINLLSNYKFQINAHIIKIHEIMFKILIDKIEELENKK